MRTAFALPALMLLHSSIVGCATATEKPPPATDDEQREIAAHLVVVDSLGRIDYVANGLARPAPCNDIGTAPAFSEGVVETICGRPIPVETLFTRFANVFVASSSPKDILFYFNGGMNATSDVIKQANDQYGAIQRDGYFPIFMAWPTGAVGSYFEQIYKTSNGLYSEAPATVTGTSRMVSDILVGAARAPGDWAYNFQRFQDSILDPTCTFLVFDPELKSDDDLTSRAQNCIERGRTERQPDAYHPPSHRVRNGEVSDPERQVIFSDHVNRGPSGWSDGIKLTATGVPRVIVMPFADGLGEQAWKNMKRRTQRSVRAENELAGEGWAWDELRKRYPHGLGGFAQFLALLEACAREVDTMPPCPPEVTRAARVKLREASVTLVGHSMGTMVIDLLVEAFPHLSYRDIVFLSGAATINQAKAALDPLLRGGKGNVRFYNLMLHPMNDAREINGVGVVPSGSLLVWIDDMLEHPDTLLDRTVGQWTNMRGGRRHFSREAREWMQLKVFDRAADGNGWNVRTHGGFNDDDVPFWRRTFWSTEAGRPCDIPVRFGNEPPFPGLGCPQPATNAELGAP